MCTFGIFINLLPVGLEFEKGTFDPIFGWLGGTCGGREWANLIARPWVPISSPLTCMVYLLPFMSYSACPEAFPLPTTAPVDLDTKTITALEAKP